MRIASFESPDEKPWGVYYIDKDHLEPRGEYMNSMERPRERKPDINVRYFGSFKFDIVVPNEDKTRHEHTTHEPTL